MYIEMSMLGIKMHDENKIITGPINKNYHETG